MQIYVKFNKIEDSTLPVFIFGINNVLFLYNMDLIDMNTIIYTLKDKQKFFEKRLY
jgi:hypothetical protein